MRNQKPFKGKGPFLFFFAALLLAYSPLISGLFSLKNDTLIIDYVQKLNSHWQLQDGDLPLLNPVWGLGTSTHTVTLWSAFNPIHLLLTALPNYSLYILQLEMFLYVLIGGIGMFLFLRKPLQFSLWLALVGSIMFVCCGPVHSSISLAENMYGYLMLPWLCFGAYAFFEKPNLKTGCLLAVCIYVSIVSAFPFTSIVNAYLLVLIFLYTQVKQARWAYLKRSLLFLLPSVLLLAFPIYFSLQYLQDLPAVADAIALPQKSTSNWDFRGLYSFIHPLFLEDVLPNQYLINRNYYFGLLALLTALYGAVSQKRVATLLVLGIAFLALSFIAHRSWLFDHIPLLSRIGHYQNFRIYASFFMILAFLNAIKSFDRDHKYAPAFHWVLILVFCLLVVFKLLSNSTETISFSNLWWSLLVVWVPMLVFLILQLKKKLNYKGILILVAFELIVTNVFVGGGFGLSKLSPKEVTAEIEPAKKAVFYTHTAAYSRKIGGFGKLNEYKNKVSLDCKHMHAAFHKNFLNHCISGQHESEKVVAIIQDRQGQLPTEFKMEDYSIQDITFSVESEQSDTITYLQNQLTGWKAHVNGQRVPILEQGDGLLHVAVKPGKSTIRLHYNPWLKKLSVFWVYMLLLLFGGVLWRRSKQ